MTQRSGNGRVASWQGDGKETEKKQTTYMYMPLEHHPAISTRQELACTKVFCCLFTATYMYLYSRLMASHGKFVRTMNASFVKMKVHFSISVLEPVKVSLSLSLSVKVSLSFDLHLKETAITKNSLFSVVRTTSHLKRTHTNYTPVKITHCVMKRQTWVIFIC